MKNIRNTNLLALFCPMMFCRRASETWCNRARVSGSSPVSQRAFGSSFSELPPKLVYGSYTVATGGMAFVVQGCVWVLFQMFA